MIGARTVSVAVERGIITAAQLDQLRALEAELGAAAADTGTAVSHEDERLRFVSGFGDIFVTIGLALFLTAVAYFAEDRFGGAGRWAALAATSWLLAEYFTRRRRMALPSLVLLVVFAGSVMAAATLVFGGRVFGFGAWVPDLADGSASLPLFGAGLVTVAAAFLHYLRFRLPITVAAGAAALVASVLGLAAALVPGLFAAALQPLLVACGLGVFALAMWFDMSDPQRRTRRADIAFWLHLLAAPLIVHPLFEGLAGGGGGAIAALPVLLTFVALGAVAVLIDRRALLVSGLAYAGYAFAALVQGSGLYGLETPLTLLVLGAFVLLLSAAWHPLRRLILSLLPADLARRLPQP